MSKLRLLSVLLILSVSHALSSQGKNFFFIQITDPQFGFFENNKGFSRETTLYEKAVEEVNRLEPAFVVLTGDLVNNRDDSSQIAEFKRITGRISCPVYFSPGNHDIGQAPERKDIDRFIENYGHDRFSFRYKKSLFIGINSCLIKSATPVLEEEQMVWLRKELSKAKNSRNILVFTHYPFFIKTPDETEAYFNIPPATREKYLQLFRENNVTAVLAGHLHNNGHGRDGKMEMITTSAVGKPLSSAPSGIRIVIVRKDGINSAYYGLEEIPQSIRVN